MDYQQAWSYLDQLQFFKIKLGLESMAAFLDSVDQPQRDLQCIHVGGTNGKGSVSVTLLTLLSAAGYKVGLFTSPHLSSVRERFRINDSFISEEDFAAVATQIRHSLGEKQITYFEFTTALALLWFARQQVDLVILEVGLGGRLDATNVITPLVSVITNVSMDHEAHLGNTLTEVATEKAGIIKSGIPLVSGVAADESLQVVSSVCAEKGAPFYLLGRDYSVSAESDGLWGYTGISGQTIHGLPPVMRGVHQMDNTGVALAVLECLADHGFPVSESLIKDFLPQVHWPGRLEYFCLDPETRKTISPVAMTSSAPIATVKQYLLDGAHNPAGLSSLTSSLEKDFCYKRLICIWASMSDKDIAKTLLQMVPLCDILIFTRPEAERSATTETLQKLVPQSFGGEIYCVETVEDALVQAESCAENDDLICVAGSLYLIGAARQILLGSIVD